MSVDYAMLAMLAVLAVVTFVFQSEFHARLTVFGAIASVVAVGVLLLAFAMLRSQDVWEQLSLYAFGSVLVAALAFSAAATGHGSALYALGAVTIGFKALVVPLGIGVRADELEGSLSRSTLLSSIDCEKRRFTAMLDSNVWFADRCGVASRGVADEPEGDTAAPAVDPGNRSAFARKAVRRPPSTPKRCD